MKKLILLLAVLVLAGCATGTTIQCQRNSNACFVEREGYISEVIYLKRCGWLGKPKCDE